MQMQRAPSARQWANAAPNAGVELKPPIRPPSVSGGVCSKRKSDGCLLSSTATWSAIGEKIPRPFSGTFDLAGIEVTSTGLASNEGIRSSQSRRSCFKDLGAWTSASGARNSGVNHKMLRNDCNWS